MLGLDLEYITIQEVYNNKTASFIRCQIIINVNYYPPANVGYEMIDSQRGAYRQVGYNHCTSNKREWNNCFTKTNHEILLDLADFALQEQPEGNLMVTNNFSGMV